MCTFLGLLKEWQDLLFGVKHLLASRDSSLLTNEHRDNSDALLHAEIGRLSQTLKELIGRDHSIEALLLMKIINH